jgi:hypothetical protein
MTTYAVERTIAAPAETIWALLTDASSFADWNTTVVDLQGTIAPGEKIALKSTLDPKRTFKLKVTEFEAPRRMVWSSGMPLGLFTGRRTYELTPAGNGNTTYSMREEFTGLMAPLITKSIPDMTENFTEFAAALAAAAEGKAS